MALRTYTQKEWRLLSWWLATYHHQADISMNVRVGPLTSLGPDDTSISAASSQPYVRNRWADAIFIENNELWLVEAKLAPDPGIFSQLVHYARKLRADPSFAFAADMPLHLVALVYHDDPSVREEAPWYGVQWVVYQPNLQGFPQAASGLNALMPAGSLLPSDWPARLKSWGVVALGGV